MEGWLSHCTGEQDGAKHTVEIHAALYVIGCCTGAHGDSGFNRLLQGSVTESFMVLHSLTWFYSVLQGVRACYRVLQSITGCWRV